MPEHLEFNEEIFNQEFSKLIANYDTHMHDLSELYAQRLLICLNKGMGIDEAVEKAAKSINYFDKYKEVIVQNALLATAHGYGIMPKMLARPDKIIDKLLNESWIPDEMPLSKKLHGTDPKMRQAIVDTVGGAMQNQKSFKQMGLDLYNGYGKGQVINTAELPKYLKNLEFKAFQVAGGGGVGKPGYKRFQRTLQSVKGQVNRLSQNGAPTKGLKAAYSELLQAAESLNKEALESAVQTAIHERARYYADRIARTEMARARTEAYLAKYANDDDCIGYKWTLSSRHTDVDICDFHANVDLYGMGAGVYPKNEYPAYPAHPHCMCHPAAKFIGEDDNLMKVGEFHPLAGKQFIQNLPDTTKKQLLGVAGAKKFAEGGTWEAHLKNYQGNKVLKARITPEMMGIKPAPEIKFEPPQPSDPLPDMDELQYLEDGGYLGGAGKKSIYVDKYGNKYLYKPALSKSGNPEAFRAHVQDGVAKLSGKLFDGGDYINLKAVEGVDGNMGTLQHLVPDVMGDLKKLGIGSLNPAQLKRIQQEHLVDFVTGNFDSHPGNFVLTKDGKILAVDKEQAFRYFIKAESKDMSLWYHPNAAYGESEPIYNTLFRKFANSEIDLDLNTVLPQLQRLEAISDVEYKQFFRGYVNELYGTGKNADAILNEMVTRKNGMREKYRDFFTMLLKQRDPNFSGKFKFADEMVEAGQRAKQPLAARLFAKHDLEKMSTGSLAKMCKEAGYKYVSYMSKGEMVDIMAYPDRADEIMLRVKERCQTTPNAINKKTGVKAPSIKKTKKAGKGMPDIFDDFDNVPKDKLYGLAVKKDSGSLEGQQLTVRRARVDGKDGYIVSFKVPEELHTDLSYALSKRKASLTGFGYNTGYIDEATGKYVIDANPYRTKDIGKCLKLVEDNIEARFVADSDKYALKGTMEIRVVDLDGKQAAARVKKLLDDIKLGQVVKDTTAEDELIYKLNRIAWQYAPKEMSTTLPKDRSVTWLRNIIEEKTGEKADDMLGRLEYKEVFAGYHTYTLKGQGQAMKERGAKYLFAGVGNDAETVAKIVSSKSPGLMSTVRRYENGLFDAGASTGSDIESGGADSAFLRLVTDSAKGGHFGNSFKGNGYRLMYDVNVLDRTDWYAYGDDNYGNVKNQRFSNRLTPLNFAERLNSDFRPSNEVMLRKGVSNEHLIGITCDDNILKQYLITELKSLGVTKLNGKTLDKFIKVQTKYL